jgi:hypothetical protein
MICGQLFCFEFLILIEWFFNKLIWQIEIGESIGFLLLLIF